MLTFSEPTEIAYSSIYKPKIHRVVHEGQEALLTVYGNRTLVGRPAWDYRGDRFEAGDIFVRRSVDGGETWSAPSNLSQTGHRSSIQADHDGDPLTPETRFYGDSGKPVVVSNGSVVVVVWDDAYAEGGNGPAPSQGRATYKEAGDLEVPYRAVWAVTSADGGATWRDPQRLTDASRDAKQASIKAAGSGFAIVWQEDPEGLRPGEGDGPGEGGSGATVNGGTDIWYTALNMEKLLEGAAWPAPRRITDNELAPVQVQAAHSEEGGLEGERAGASRPQVALFGGLAVVAYEETKGSGGTESGKYIRYHVFSAFDGGKKTPDATEGRGWILSTPSESGRRVRILPQGTPGPKTGLRVAFCWRQGLYDCGGPADICLRVGLADPADETGTGLMPGELRPPVGVFSDDPAFAALDPLPVNISSSVGLDALSDDDPLENARAHRGFLRGDRIVFGYVWTPDGAAADLTALANYDFYLRTSSDGGATWTVPKNLSQLTDTSISVREPRLVPTPSGPGRLTDVFYAAWSTERNQYEHLDHGAINLDVFLTVTYDGGASFAPVCPVAATEAAEGESQWCTTPDGSRVWGVWSSESPDGSANRGGCTSGRFQRPEDPGSTGSGNGSVGGQSP